ncbi:succinyl-diaminopimelate desuccinylase [Ehrlichia chaffeensis str. Heartland]|uniref:succinyl-diaminopimelate desuccinylase n=1 Tax=Ehrlichia chaffeensis TaxID=945 RepID=UPI000053A969|nr:succinyl-diaminopimelate desuccinylase [Ehrlichia chaffeensis]AHX04057.1 succinyl-diaminopimelate desuccinylase [Ehrlichia chaffeensis str. Heartland]AHX08867.1 succinyl-diaminopimelate desuccinylase [Ehrlichia chaffeensis str. Saint Vincent]AHX10617.1 succinyl-diaminopimelate desuccinylase [Ehrlichia chaffeensis str. West Paces]
MAIDPVILSQELISFPSITPTDNGAIDFLSNTLSQYGFTCNVLTFGNDEVQVCNLYAQLGNGHPNLCFAGHTDVVPTGDLEKWKFDPFSGHIEDNILYGRGAVDMKSAICAFIAAVSRIDFNQVNGAISLMISGDEEGNHFKYGTPAILKWLTDNNKKIDYCLVGEPTSKSSVGDTIKIGRRGSINFKIVCNGVQGHVAYPHLAQNPINDMINILHKINNTVLDEGNEYFQPSNCEITSVDVGNTANNVIPGTVTAHLNIRYNNIHTSESLFNIINNICAETTQKYQIFTLLSGDPFINYPDKYSDMLSAAIKKTTGETAVISTSGGTSDARFIKDFCPVIELGLKNDTAHKINENTSVDDINKLANIYEEFIKQFFNISQ